MSNSLKYVQFQCSNCRAWFSSPIGFTDDAAFDSSTVNRMLAQCQACGQVVACRKENMRWVRSDGKGGFVGIDTQG